MKRRSIFSILCGIVLVGVAVAWLGDAFGAWDIGALKGWWTLFLIVPGIAGMISEGPDFWNVMLTGGGLWLFLRAQKFDFLTSRQVDVISGSLVLIIFGLWLIFHSFFKKKIIPPPEGTPYTEGSATYSDAASSTSNASGPVDYEAKPSYFSFLSGNKSVNASQNFMGGSAFAFLGSCYIDLSGVSLTQNAQFDASTFMGSVRIIAPRNVRVAVQGTPILGSFTNRAPIFPVPDHPVLTITGMGLLGSVEII